MSSPQATSAHPTADDHGSQAAAWAGRAFGLSIESDFPVLGLVRCEAGAGDRIALRRTTAELIDSAWSWERSEPILERVQPDGSPLMWVHRHPELGYRIDAVGHGRYHVSPDGSLIRCAPVDGPSWLGCRPLFAQVLPLAASLNGLELLHASAVTIGDRAIAFTGHSGAGKTSLAVQLVARGSALVADDVLALSASDGELLAHPGVRLANVASEQLDSLSAKQRARLGPVIGESDKRHVSIRSLEREPRPLGGLYFLRRSGGVQRLRIERVPSPDPRSLLAATFMPHVSTPVRLRAQLDVCASICGGVPTFGLDVPPDVDAGSLALHVSAHAAELDRDAG